MVKYGNKVSVLYGRCLHRGALSREAKIALSKGSEMAGEAEQVRRRPY